jgi:hypothetical protein
MQSQNDRFIQKAPIFGGLGARKLIQNSKCKIQFAECKVKTQNLPPDPRIGGEQKTYSK